MASETDLLAWLQRHGRSSAAELRQALGISPPTLMRTLRRAGPAVLALGQGPRRAYAARRPLRGESAPLPLYRVDVAGELREQGRLHLAAPQGSVLEWQGANPWPLDHAMRDGWFEGLPYLLRDLRPEGFLGRQFAHRHAALLRVPEDPRLWSDDDVLHAQSLVGADLGGDLILGEAAARLWLTQRQSPPVPLGDAPWPAYAALAAQALAGGHAGSSAGGEFPKFTTQRLIDGQIVSVLVKFSGDDASPGTQRWSDLLVCESIALALVEQLPGLVGATTRCIQYAGRSFLESVRFDRQGAQGRLPLCSWQAINEDWFGLPGRPWPEGAAQLHARGLIDVATQAAIRLLWQFGLLIGNTDMHDGNLSFRPATGERGAGFALAPVYDMLPMAWAPRRGVELPTVQFAPQLPLPAERAHWHAAAAVAAQFWRHAADDARISAGFRAICAANAPILDALRSRA